MAGEDLGDAVEHPALLPVDLEFQAVLARESDLHARKEGRQQQHRKYENDNRKHRYRVSDFRDSTGRTPSAGTSAAGVSAACTGTASPDCPSGRS